MRKILPYLFPMGYGCFAALLCTAAIHGLSAVMAISDAIGHPARWLLVCGAACLAALLCLAGLLIGNVNCAQELPHPKLTAAIELAESLLLLLLFWGVWDKLFHVMSRIFFY